MKIERSGETFKFECKYCGCRFIVGTNDPILKRDGASAVTGGNEMLSYECPCCGEKCKSKASVTVMDGGYTRIETQVKEEK